MRLPKSGKLATARQFPSRSGQWLLESPNIETNPKEVTWRLQRGHELNVLFQVCFQVCLIRLDQTSVYTWRLPRPHASLCTRRRELPNRMQCKRSSSFFIHIISFLPRSIWPYLAVFCGFHPCDPTYFLSHSPAPIEKTSSEDVKLLYH